MKPKFFLVATFFACALCACNPDVVDPHPYGPRPEVIDPITNDFTLVKACLAKSWEEAVELVMAEGYTPSEKENQYVKSENGTTKTVHCEAPYYVALVASGKDFEIQKQVFVQWMNEFMSSSAFPNLVRSSIELCTGWDNGRQHFDTPQELLDSFVCVPYADGMSASFVGYDCYANKYSLTFFPILSNMGVYMELSNPRTDSPDDFTESDLEKADLRKHILISKVDYLTFQYKGFYALNVINKVDTGSLIPFLTEYKSPSDFGYIKMYYSSTDNLLMSGTIVWNGCGALEYPENFRAGLPLINDLPYPGQDRIAFINDAGDYTTTTDETYLRNIWNTLSKQKEFQYYYKHSTKKVAVYRYAPSVGWFDPYAAYYLVFTEQ